MFDTRPVATSTARSAASLAADLRNGTAFGIVFGGQGAAWLDPLRDLVRDHGLGEHVIALASEAEARLAPLAAALAPASARFTVKDWLDVQVDDEAPAPDTATGTAPTSAAISVPGIALTQLTAIEAMRRLSLDPTNARGMAGHSQGVLALEAVRGAEPVDVLVAARLIGAAAQIVGRRRGLVGAGTMVSISRVVPSRIDDELAAHGDDRVVRALINGRRSVVVSGPSDAVAGFVAHLESVASAEQDRRDRKLVGGAPFSPIIEPVDSTIAFHHPDLAEAADLAASWAAAAGLDAGWVADLARRSIIDPMDWAASLHDVIDSGADWILDLGPGDLATRLVAPMAKPRGLGIVPSATSAGLRALTVVGAAPSRPTPWADFAPKVIALPDGTTRVETAFTRLTGKSPILLAGMTPTTVDAKIVAAAANAGFWAELAGGGQVTEQIFTDRIAELDGLLDPGVSFAFNSLLLDPYLWKLQLGGQRLVQKARAAGAPIDAVIVTAGVPELDEAVELITELRDLGIEHVVFKPGTVAQIKQVLAIAREVAPTPIIVQIEGGKAGGHHSWEDLDELVLASYADVRADVNGAESNVVVCVGGGIGTPEVAADWLTGAWAIKHGFDPMPVDGVLVGTAAMATAEATTSPAVKQLLVDTPGTPDWVGAGTATGGMASGRSQLGADIHEIDNTASRVGRLLDEVAGDAEAVAKRFDEIAAALDQTAKPWFGDLGTMSYGALVRRFAELCAPDGQWLDVTFLARFHALIQRVEARLADADRGEIETAFVSVDDVRDPAAALETLRQNHPELDDVRLHPADRHFFVEVCARPGKPVPFVPVIDADVRRAWRSDSLWQAHDPRYGADEVCVIPGTVSVAGITRADEPVAELLARFENTTVDTLLSEGLAPAEVAGRRRSDDATGPVALVLAAPDVEWAGRTVVNPLRQLESLDDVDVVELAADRVEVRVPVGERVFALELLVPTSAALGGVPIVTAEAAARATSSLIDRGPASATVRWEAGRVADHAAVSGVDQLADGGLPQHPTPDVLVGLAWPAVFGVLADSTGPDGLPLMEGMLDLVHLDHAISVAAPGAVPADGVDLRIEAQLVSVEDTDLGRVVTIDVRVGEAVLRERFCIRGRLGTGELADPATAGGTLDGTTSGATSTPRRSRVRTSLSAPDDMTNFAHVTGDHNPIHTLAAAAQLAGLGAPIVHGMWTSAAAQYAVAVETGRRIEGWTSRFLAPVRPGSLVEVRADRTGLAAGAEVLDVTVRADGEIVMAATALLAAPRTAYAFPGQGIQSKGMGMAGYQRCPAAREIWDRADRHTRDALGFSILQIVRDNPTELTVDGTTHHHPDGVLYLTQFTQVAMAVLGAAQMAELKAADAFVEGAVLAGHSVGEYNALAAVTGVIELETIVDVVFRRGSVMHTLVPRDENGRSNYRLAAIRPSQIGLADDDVPAFVASVTEAAGEFCQIVNYNLRGSQYAIAGTVAGLAALETEIERRRAEVGGKAAFILVPGIDVPFHSQVLHGGVPDFRARLDELLPPHIDPAILEGRYIPNLVPRPFSLSEDFITEVEGYVGVTIERDADPRVLCRTLLIELLAWQFASPVRWIETQDLMFTPRERGGLGVERLVEVGVGSAPTVANLASGTLKLPGYGRVEVLNIERDAAVVFATDEDPTDDADRVPANGPQPPVADRVPAESGPQPPVADRVPANGPQPPVADRVPARNEPVYRDQDTQPPVADRVPARNEPVSRDQDTPDLPFTAADATRILLAWWNKLGLDQLAPSDSIESLTDGASSRRNQILLDLGSELSLGAIDGAAEADLGTLGSTVESLARGYKPFGPVLAESLGDHLKKVLGPAGIKSAAVTDRVVGTWQLGSGWAHHVTAELALMTRDGASVRGGDLGSLGPINSGADAETAIDAAVQSVAQRHGVTVAMPSSGGGEEALIDSAALAEFTSTITGPSGVLAGIAETISEHLGFDDGHTEPVIDESAAETLARVEAELGSAWIKATAPALDARRAFVLDDRWASAREDLARVAHGGTKPDLATFVGAGEVVAAQATWWAEQTGDEFFSRVATLATNETPGAYADDVALVTGASEGSIAASVVAGLLSEAATVIATTSHITPEKLAFFKALYRQHARAGASLWVVPANMASFADVDDLVEWISTEQTQTAAGVTTVAKTALAPTLLFPFAAGRVIGDVAEAGSRAEVEMRILVWSLERLIGRLTEANETRVHVVLPGSPNRGTFGGDGAYGEAKAALDALVAKWSVEGPWTERTTIVHALIGWVRGTGLMGGNDPLVEAVEAAGVRTWSTDEMADALLATCSAEVREQAGQAPVQRDLTGGLADVALDLGALARQAHEAAADADTGVAAETETETDTIAALPASPYQLDRVETPAWGEVTESLDDMVVIVGTGELGPLGSARTRFEIEVDDRLSAAGVLELAWVTGLVTWDDQRRTWFDTESGDDVAEADIADRYEDVVRERVGVRRYADDDAMVDNTSPLLTSIYLEKDMTFTVGSQAEALAMRSADPERTRIAQTADGDWSVTRQAGSEVRVPRRFELTRTVGGQIPEGFDATRWGIPAEMVGSLDRVAVWNLVATVDAFLSSGFTPAELLRWVHPAFVANTQGTGMGGMTSMRSLYLDTLLGEPKPNDILQEALPNVIAAHVMQSYVGGYGAMVHPVAACATTAVSVEEGVDKIRLGKAEFVVAGGFDDLSIEGIVGFGDMSATAPSQVMADRGIEDRRFSRANDRRYGGFVESAGGGTILLARASLAARQGLPVLGVVAHASSHADGVHTSIPAPGLGALGAALGGPESMLARSLRRLGVGPDDIGVVSKHDTSTGVNERNESELHERLAAAIGRSAGNPLYVVSQKTLTGHAKGGAAAFQINGLCQVLARGVVPPNRSLDCVMDDLAEHGHLVWLREPLATGALKAGLVTSLGFGHVAGLIAIVHPQAFIEALGADAGSYQAAAQERELAGRARIVEAMYGGAALYERPSDRRLGSEGVREREAGMLLDGGARLRGGIYE